LVASGGVDPPNQDPNEWREAALDRTQSQTIREWAKRKKIQLSGRGRIPRHVIEQYQAESGQ
jgi:hypothetical protein